LQDFAAKGDGNGTFNINKFRKDEHVFVHISMDASIDPFCGDGLY